MITVSKDIIHNSVRRENEVLSKMRRDSEHELDKDVKKLIEQSKKNKKKNGNMNLKVKNQDPIPNISLEDFIKDSDSEDENDVRNHKNKVIHSSNHKNIKPNDENQNDYFNKTNVSKNKTQNQNQNENNLKLQIGQNLILNNENHQNNHHNVVSTMNRNNDDEDNADEIEFEKMKIEPTLKNTAKSALSSMIESNREALTSQTDFPSRTSSSTAQRVSSHRENTTLNSQNSNTKDREERKDSQNSNSRNANSKRNSSKYQNNDETNKSNDDSSDEEVVAPNSQNNDENHIPSRVSMRKSMYSDNDSNEEKKFEPFVLKVSIEEFLGEIQPLEIKIDEPWTVAQLIENTIKQFKVEHKDKSLQNEMKECYELYEMDDDEIDKDIRPFDSKRLIHQCNVQHVAIVYNAKKKVTTTSNNPTSSSHLSIISGDNETLRQSILDKLENDLSNINDKKLTYIRIRVPGPITESTTIPIDQEAKSKTIRDLFDILNKKKQTAAYHPSFFDVYYDGQTKEQPINKQLKVLDLKKKNLIILPRIIGENDSDRVQAYQFPLVQLANEPREYHTQKIKNGQKKPRILGVDRYRIVKKGFEDNSLFKIGIGKRDHMPIDITSVVEAKVESLNPKQFRLEYNHPDGGKRFHIYELESKQECEHIVSKITFLSILRSLQG